MQDSPGVEVPTDANRALGSRQQQRAAAQSGEPNAQRSGGAHGLVERVAARWITRIEHNQRPSLILVTKSAFEEGPGARDRGPMDQRRRGAVAVRAQPIDIAAGGIARTRGHVVPKPG